MRSVRSLQWLCKTDEIWHGKRLALENSCHNYFEQSCCLLYTIPWWPSCNKKNPQDKGRTYFWALVPYHVSFFLVQHWLCWEMYCGDGGVRAAANCTWLRTKNSIPVLSSPFLSWHATYPMQSYHHIECPHPTAHAMGKGNSQWWYDMWQGILHATDKKEECKKGVRSSGTALYSV